jgi:hypothetical protein
LSEHEVKTLRPKHCSTAFLHPESALMDHCIPS